jgi:hypothetical protein
LSLDSKHRTFSLSTKDYSEYWGVQVLLVRILKTLGIKVDIRDRLPLFRLWNIVNSRMTGAKKHNILQLIQSLVHMRQKNMEPPNDGKRYV